MTDLDRLTAIAYAAYVEALIEAEPLCKRRQLINSHCGRKELRVAELPIIRAVVERVVEQLQVPMSDHADDHGRGDDE